MKKTAVFSTVPWAAPLASEDAAYGLGDFFLERFFGLSGITGFLSCLGVFKDLLTYMLLREGTEIEIPALLFSFPYDSMLPWVDKTCCSSPGAEGKTILVINSFSFPLAISFIRSYGGSGKFKYYYWLLAYYYI
jgi:hypothetical protein